jgi:HNH endonuclease
MIRASHRDALESADRIDMPRASRFPIELTREEREAFWGKVEFAPHTAPHEHWIWTGRVDDSGYGIVKIRGRSLRAHRIAWTLERGPIPVDLTLDHVCRNARCVNPSHLEAVTSKENILRGESPTAVNARKSHCQRGHALTPDNLVKHAPGSARARSRDCLECLRQKTADRRMQAAK